MFANNLKTARQLKGYSQRALAELIGATQSTVSNWELGYRSPDISTVKKLAAILGVSVDALTDTVDESPRLSDEEKTALELFRALDPADRAATIAMMDAVKKVRKTPAKIL